MTPINQHDWTDAEIRWLKYAWHMAYCERYMAERLGRSLNSVRNAIRRYIKQGGADRTNGRDWLPDEIERLAKMRKAGMTVPQICGVLGRTPSSVKNALTKHVYKTDRAE